MSWLHGWPLAAGALALALPVLIHLLARPNPSPYPLSTFRFVEQLVRERGARSRLRDALVLAMRTAAVALLALAFARPAQETPLSGSAAERGTARVVVLDVSRSMAARRAGLSAFERGRAVAAPYLARRAGLRAALVLAGARPRSVFDGFSGNSAALGEELRRCSVKQEAADLRAAIDLAGGMLATAQPPPAGRRELVIVSDLQRTSWSKVSFDGVPPDVRPVLETVALEASPGNLAPVAVTWRDRPQAGANTAIGVDVANHSDATRTVTVELRLGERVQTRRIVCDRWSTGVALFDSGTLPEGWLRGSAALLDAADSLPDDDRLPFAAQAQAPRPVVLVTADSSAERRSAWYLECALAAGKAGGDARPLQRTAPRDLDAALARRARLLVLAGAGKLEPVQLSLLASALRAGCAVLALVESESDVANLAGLQKALGVRWPIAFDAGRRGRRQRKDSSLAWADRDRAPFAVFGSRLESAFSRLKFRGGWPAVEARQTGASQGVLARLNDGTPLLAVAETGGAALAILNCDLTASDLPRSAAFVPLIAELADCLLPATNSGPGAPVPGLPFVGRLELAGTGFQLEDEQSRPAGQAQFEPDERGVLLRWREAGPPGVYRAVRQGTAEALLAVACPSAESDLRALEASVVTGQLASSRRLWLQPRERAGRPPDSRDELWPMITLAIAFLLLAELNVLKIFRT